MIRPCELTDQRQAPQRLGHSRGSQPGHHVPSFQALTWRGACRVHPRRGIGVAGTPERGAVVVRAKELLDFARRQGFRSEEFIAISKSFGLTRLGLWGEFDRHIAGRKSMEEGNSHENEIPRRSTTALGPQLAQEVQILPNRPTRSRVSVVAGRDPPVQVGYTVPERLDVQLAWFERLIGCGGNLCHFFEVNLANVDFEIEEFSHALLGCKEKTPLKVLSRCKSDISGAQPGHEQGVRSHVRLGVLVANGTTVHSQL